MYNVNNGKIDKVIKYKKNNENDKEDIKNANYKERNSVEINAHSV